MCLYWAVSMHCTINPLSVCACVRACASGKTLLIIAWIYKDQKLNWKKKKKKNKPQYIITEHCPIFFSCMLYAVLKIKCLEILYNRVRQFDW